MVSCMQCVCFYYTVHSSVISEFRYLILQIQFTYEVAKVHVETFIYDLTDYQSQNKQNRMKKSKFFL